MRLFDVQHPFFQPLWRRVAIVAFCFAWALVELLLGNAAWAVLFGGIGAYCGYQFFIVLKATQDGEKPD